MANLILVIGLPGSGKSYWAKEFNKKHNNKYLIIDDPKHISEVLCSEKDVIITDSLLCDENIRTIAANILSSYYTNIEYVYFENNERKCWNNIVERNDGRVFTKEGLKSFHYRIPSNVKPLTIYQKNET